MATRYKFVELSVVTEESLEKAVNEWVARQTSPNPPAPSFSSSR